MCTYAFVATIAVRILTIEYAITRQKVPGKRIFEAEHLDYACH